MKVLFLTMDRFVDINDKGIYTDLMRRFCKDSHEVYIVSPVERREGKPTYLNENEGIHLLRVKTLNLQKTNIFEKGIGQVLLEYSFRSAISKYFGEVKFDLVLYSTPPISFSKVIKWVKNRTGAMSYLMLKDIFPQNAVDLGMLSKSGIKGLLYQYFRNKERELYNISDYIGCMSPANVQYVLSHNTDVDKRKTEICPNSLELIEDEPPSINNGINIREKYNLPSNLPLFIYGGNLGKPQGIPFLIKCLDANKDRTDCHFIVVGSGSEYYKIEEWVSQKSPHSVSLFKGLPIDDYEQLVCACNVGLIFLDYRFTIPNYPSRLLSYMRAKKPIIVCSDKNSDMGLIAEENKYGFYCESNDVNGFTLLVDKILNEDMVQMGINGYNYFMNNYTVDNSFNAIIKHLK